MNIKNILLKVKRLFKKPSQFLITLKRGEYNKAYAFYFYSILNGIDKKDVAKKQKQENVNQKRQHEKIRERMLHLANVSKTKYDQNEYTKKFFDLLQRSENFPKPKSKNVFLNALVNKLNKEESLDKIEDNK